MSRYSDVVKDLANLPTVLAYYDNELANARKEISIFGNIEKNIAALPGITEYRFNQLQELEAILNHLNIQLRKIRRTHFQKYLENYARALTARDAEKYVDGEPEVIDMETLINEVALVRNKYLGILKGLESKNFMIGHVTRLRTAGMEDATINT